MTEGEVPSSAKDLFALPLEEFTESRNELARRLKSDGDSDAAAAVKGLRKPRVSAWVVNQLARERRDDVATLVELTEKLRAAESPQVFRELSAERHEIVERLGRSVDAVVAGSGAKATPAVLHEVTQTLRAATAPEELKVLREGVLTEPLEASGFGGMSGPLEFDEPEQADVEPRKDPELEKLEARLEEARAEFDDKKRYAEQSRRAAEEAEQEVEEAQRSLDRLQDRITRRQRSK